MAARAVIEMGGPALATPHSLARGRHCPCPARLPAVPDKSPPPAPSRNAVVVSSNVSGLRHVHHTLNKDIIMVRGADARIAACVPWRRPCSVGHGAPNQQPQT